jgi:hypothetical protein
VIVSGFLLDTPDITDRLPAKHDRNALTITRDGHGERPVRTSRRHSLARNF